MGLVRRVFTRRPANRHRRTKTARQSSGGTPSANEAGEQNRPAVADANDSFVKFTEFTHHHGPVYAARFSPAGDRVATAGYDGRVLCGTPTKRKASTSAAGSTASPIRRLTKPNFSPTAAQYARLRLHPTAKRSSAADKTMRSSSGTCRREAAQASPRACQLMSAASTLARRPTFALRRTRRTDETLAPRNLRRRARPCRRRDEDSRDADTFGPVLARRSAIVTAGRDRSASVWNAGSFERLEHLAEGHDFLASSARLLRRWLASGDRRGDGTVRLWDVATGAEGRATRRHWPRCGAST